MKKIAIMAVTLLTTTSLLVACGSHVTKKTNTSSEKTSKSVNHKKKSSKKDSSQSSVKEIVSQSVLLNQRVNRKVSLLVQKNQFIIRLLDRGKASKNLVQKLLLTRMVHLKSIQQLQGLRHLVRIELWTKKEIQW